jgi:hypothetical protein
MRFLGEDRAVAPSAGYPFLAAGSEDAERINAGLDQDHPTVCTGPCCGSPTVTKKEAGNGR